MPFANEQVLPQDKSRYRLKHDPFYQVPVLEFTIDRERDMFLARRTGGGPESPPGNNWAFYWKGHLLDVRLRLMQCGVDEEGGHGWERTRVDYIDGLGFDVVPHRAQILGDLKEALTARRGLGLYSKLTSYEVVLEDGDGVGSGNGDGEP